VQLLLLPRRKKAFELCAVTITARAAGNTWLLAKWLKVYQLPLRPPGIDVPLVKHPAERGARPAQRNFLPNWKQEAPVDIDADSLVSCVALQTGFRPVFPFNSLFQGD